MHKQAKGSILLLLCAMIWGAAFVAQSEGMQYVGPFTMGATRFFLAGLVLLPVIAVLDRKGWSQNRPVTGAEKKKQLLSGMICGALLFAATTLQQFGLLDTTVGKSGFVTALYIVFVPILGALMGRRAGRRRLSSRSAWPTTVRSRRPREFSSSMRWCSIWRAARCCSRSISAMSAQSCRIWTACG